MLYETKARGRTHSPSLARQLPAAMAVFAEPGAAQSGMANEVLNELRHPASTTLPPSETPSCVPEAGWQFQNSISLPVHEPQASHAGGALRPVLSVAHVPLALLREGQGRAQV